MWKILKKRLRCRPYRLQLVHVLRDGDKEKRQLHCGEMFYKMENENDYPNNIVFIHKANFHLSGKVNRHNIIIWGTENPHEIVQYVCGIHQN
jgi:hypothetical protein